MQLKLSEAIKRAKKAGACKGDLKVLQRLPDCNVLDLKHKQAPFWAYWYAKNVIRGRWIEAEPIIMRSPYRAYRYAKDVIKGRWFEAEPTIMADAEYAYWYAQNVIQGRWIEAEPTIMRSSQYAYLYAKHVLPRPNREETT